MIEISLLAEFDRAEWEALARDYKAFFDVEATDDEYEQTFRRLLDGEQIRGIVARIDGRMVGLAHPPAQHIAGPQASPHHADQPPPLAPIAREAI